MAKTKMKQSSAKTTVTSAPAPEVVACSSSAGGVPPPVEKQKAGDPVDHDELPTDELSDGDSDHADAQDAEAESDSDSDAAGPSGAPGLKGLAAAYHRALTGESLKKTLAKRRFAEDKGDEEDLVEEPSSDEEPKSKKAKLSAPSKNKSGGGGVLAHLEKKKDAELQRENLQKQISRDLKQSKCLITRGVREFPQDDPVRNATIEKQFRGIATRGLVKLIGAVHQQQKAQNIVVQSEGKKARKDRKQQEEKRAKQKEYIVKVNALKGARKKDFQESVERGQVVGGGGGASGEGGDEEDGGDHAGSGSD